MKELFMSNRINFKKTLPQGYDALSKVQEFVNNSGLDATLQELIKLRASQLNGCVFCLDMHVAEAKKMGFSDQRLMTLSAWHESPFFSDQEKAVLALTDAMTLISEEGVDDEIYEDVVDYLGEEGLAIAMLAIAQINTWNRLMVATEALPLSYKK